MVSWVRCGVWLYRFLIIFFFLTLTIYFKHMFRTIAALLKCFINMQYVRTDDKCKIFLKYPYYVCYHVNCIIFASNWIWFRWTSKRGTMPIRHAINKGADQPAHPRSLISAFVIPYLGSCTTWFTRNFKAIASIVFVSEKAGLSLTRPDTLNTGVFFASRPRYKEITYNFRKLWISLRPWWLSINSW